MKGGRGSGDRRPRGVLYLEGGPSDPHASQVMVALRYTSDDLMAWSCFSVFPPVNVNLDATYEQQLHCPLSLHFILPALKFPVFTPLRSTDLLPVKSKLLVIPVSSTLG